MPQLSPPDPAAAADLPARSGDVPVQVTAAPVFRGPVALLVVDSPDPIHAVVAERWRLRLPDHVVVVANTGHLPGRVAFAVRSATRTDLGEFLRANMPAGEGEPVGGGADPAGGVVPYPVWNAFVAKLGFGTGVMIAPDPEPAGVAG